MVKVSTSGISLPGSGESARLTAPTENAISNTFSGGRFLTVDLSVSCLIVALGALQFFLYQRSPDFAAEDVVWAELAKSILRNGSYAFNSVRERIQPPGLAAIVSLACATVGCTHDVLIRIMPVFLTLGLLVSYEVLRRQKGRATAAASCLLLSSAPPIFAAVTSRLWPSVPYLFSSMLVLFLAPKLEAANTRPYRFLWGSLVSFATITSVITQSAGIALIGAMSGYVILSFFLEPRVARSRLRVFLPIILLACFVQGLWMSQGSNPREWPLPGYPGSSYLSQLKLKSGNYPELGVASTKDIVMRVGENLAARTQTLDELITRHWISPYWASVGIAGPVLLIALGVWSSLWRSGTQLGALYFIGYECIYLLWPWSFEDLRFTLPVLPLACLYLVEGVQVLRHWFSESPRHTGTWMLLLSVILFLFSVGHSWRGGAGYGLQEKGSAIIWFICAIIFARTIWKTLRQRKPTWANDFVRKKSSLWRTFSMDRLIGAVIITYLITAGIVSEVRIGQENLSFASTQFAQVPEIQAGLWLQSHTDPQAVVAAREVSLVYYYAQRKVIWFPPITNPSVFMQGIREHHIRYVVVVARDFSYYFPSDETCFDLLYAAFPSSFRLIQSGVSEKVYQVRQDSTWGQ